MKERGLLLTDIMALRAWEGYKTQTRHPMKGKALELCLELKERENGPFIFDGKFVETEKKVKKLFDMCPWGIEGDRIYVREAMAWVCQNQIVYRATNIEKFTPRKSINWTPNIHMFKANARTWADVTYTGIEHIQDITDEDCIAEGIQRRTHPLEIVEYGGVRQNKDGSFIWLGTPRAAFQDLWDSIYGDWDKNPVVWVNHFQKI